MPALAIDIGTYSIKLVTAKPGLNPQVTRVVEFPNNIGFAVPTDDMQAEKMAEVLGNLIADNNLIQSDVRLSLPESVVSTKVITIPNLSDSELASAIGWQAEQHIPIPKDELSLEYQVLFRPPRNQKQLPMKVLLVGARKSLTERFANIFVNMGIEPTLLETNMLSLIRNLGFTTEDPATLVVNWGASNLDMGVVSKGELHFVLTQPLGGQLLTKTLQQTIGLDGVQAEEYKRNFGLDETQFEGKVKAVLMPTMQSLIGELQKSIRYFASQNPGEAVQRLVLSGGSAQLPGAVELITQNLGIEVLLAAPFATASGDIPQANHQAMSVCMGLLMRDL